MLVSLPGRMQALALAEKKNVLLFFSPPTGMCADVINMRGGFVVMFRPQSNVCASLMFL